MISNALVYTYFLYLMYEHGKAWRVIDRKVQMHTYKAFPRCVHGEWYFAAEQNLLLPFYTSRA